jgi:hypothetical protein
MRGNQIELGFWCEEISVRNGSADRPFVFVSVCLHQAAHLLHGLLELPPAKQGCAADEGIRAGLGALDSRIEGDAAIDFDVVVEIFFLTPRVGLLDLGQHFGNELLTAKPWIDRHDEQLIDLLEERLGV